MYTVFFSENKISIKLNNFCKIQETYGKFLKVDHLPNKDDFDNFDVDSDGVLFFEEWKAKF